MGRPPVPAALKVIRGNPGKRPINEQELNAGNKLESIEAPEWANLTDGGKEVWKRVAAVLHRNNLLTDLDVEGVIRYCDMLDKWYRVKKFLDKNGFSYPIMENIYEKVWEVSETGKKVLVEKRKDQKLKSMVQFPEVGVYSRLESALTKKEQEYGMTPVARTRIYAILNNCDSNKEEEADEETMTSKAFRFAR